MAIEVDDDARRRCGVPLRASELAQEVNVPLGNNVSWRISAALTDTRKTGRRVRRVTVRQIASLYLYDNELYAMEGTCKMVKDALENSARYFLSCSGETCLKGPPVNTRIIGYNFDMAQGVNYEIDLTQPEGQRIRRLT